MHRLLLTGLALAALALAACASWWVDTDYDPTFDFAGVRTWQWARVPNTAIENDPRLNNDLVNERMRSAVELVLRERGYRQVEAEADVAIAYHLGIEQQLDITTFYAPAPIFRQSYLGMQDIQVREYELGTLLIDVLTADSGRLVWRGSTQSMLHERGTPEQRDKRARKAVTTVLDQFPPRR